MSDVVASGNDQTDRESELDRRWLEESGLLDATRYRTAAGLPPDVNAARHYLAHGWRAHLEPNASFDGHFLYPYYRSAGLEGPPALTFLMLRASGWQVYATRAQAEEIASAIRSSPLFDAASYAERAGHLANLDPALHYVLVGEQMGIAPSDGFDPGYTAFATLMCPG